MGEPASVRLVRRLEWYDTDRSGHWHHTAAFRFAEAAESALLERLGLIGPIYERAGFTVPRVHFEADFFAPMHFRDMVETEVVVARVGRTSATFVASIRRGDTLCGEVRFVVVLRGGDGRPAEWPEEWRALLTGAGPQGVAPG